MIRYLAIAKSTRFLAYALFEGKMLLEVDRVEISQSLESRVLDWYNRLNVLLVEKKVSIVLLNKFNMAITTKPLLKEIYRIRGVIELCCNLNNVDYLEVQTHGWEMYITNRNPSKKEKLEIVNRGYGINLVQDKISARTNEEDIADAIILGEGVAHGRIIGGSLNLFAKGKKK